MFSIAAEHLSTHRKSQLKMIFPEFNPTAVIPNTVYITKMLGNHDLIIGQDLLHKLGANINFSTTNICWND